jgi:hypothetical protein
MRDFQIRPNLGSYDFPAPGTTVRQERFGTELVPSGRKCGVEQENTAVVLQFICAWFTRNSGSAADRDDNGRDLANR